MERHSTGYLREFLPGINLLMVSFIIFSISACFWRSDTNSEVEEIRGQEQPYKAVHLKKFNSQNLQRLIAVNDQPENAKVTECVDALLIDVSAMINEADMKAQRTKYIETFRTDTDFYHWCFYNMLAQIDIKLDSLELSFQDAYKLFMQHMKVLWIMARALDDINENNIYFVKLRKAYRYYSRAYFARDLEVITGPMDKRFDIPKPEE